MYYPPHPDHNYTRGEIESRFAEHQIRPRDQNKMLQIARKVRVDFSESAVTDPPPEAPYIRCHSHPVKV